MKKMSIASTLGSQLAPADYSPVIAKLLSLFRALLGVSCGDWAVVDWIRPEKLDSCRIVLVFALPQPS